MPEAGISDSDLDQMTETQVMDLIKLRGRREWRNTLAYSLLNVQFFLNDTTTPSSATSKPRGF
jgi:hypothetical protein